MADNKKNKRNNNRSNNMDEDFNPKFRKVRKKVCPLCADKKSSVRLQKCRTVEKVYQ